MPLTREQFLTVVEDDERRLAERPQSIAADDEFDALGDELDAHPLGGHRFASSNSRRPAMSNECGRNCIARGGPGHIVISGGCSSPNIPWRCPSAERCAFFNQSRQFAEMEEQITREAIFPWLNKKGRNYAKS